MDVVSVVCRSVVPTVQFEAVADRTQGLYFDRPCGDGWWWGAYTDAEVYDHARAWLSEVERATGLPALVALDMDSDCVDITGHDPAGGWWRACLIRSEMQTYLDEQDATVAEVFPSPAHAAGHAAVWARQAGLEPDEARLGYLFALEDPDPAIGDVTEEFLVALGLHPQ